MVALGNISGWQQPHGPVTTWMASPAAREAARAARQSDIPPSFQRAQHLRKAYDGKAMGRRLPRLMVVAWDIPGVCDIPAMTAVINAHVRQHDAYHHWFEFENGVFVLRMIDSPEVIDFVPVNYGHMDSDQIREHALTMTPETLEWDCFTFGIAQHDDYFTFYASVDHLHIDGISAGLIFFDIHLKYRHLAAAMDKHQPAARPHVRSYHDYAARQHDTLASLTLSSPEIKGWIDFAQDAGGDWPSFPLPLGEMRANEGAFVTVELLNGIDTEAFDTACRAAGARFIGGVLACAALAEHAHGCLRRRGRGRIGGESSGRPRWRQPRGDRRRRASTRRACGRSRTRARRRARPRPARPGIPRYGSACGQRRRRPGAACAA